MLHSLNSSFVAPSLALLFLAIGCGPGRSTTEPDLSPAPAGSNAPRTERGEGPAELPPAESPESAESAGPIESTEPAPAKDAAPSPALERIACIGASLTSGFGNASELGIRRDLPFSSFLRAALPPGVEPAPTVTGDGDGWFYANPDVSGPRQVAAALGTDPTLVIALDFLFWYAFGDPEPDSPRREAGYEEGLKQLERFTCPLIIGDLPNIEHALEGHGPFGGPMVHRGLFPSEAARARMNARLAEWAEARGNVAIVSLDALTTGMRSGATMRIGETEWAVAELTEALQADLLHPTVKSSLWTALVTLETGATLGGITAEAVRPNFPEAEARLQGITQPLRDAARARQEAVDERRRKREAARAQREAQQRAQQRAQRETQREEQDPTSAETGGR